MSGGATSAYTFELRLMLCPSCGAPIDVPAEGGVFQCRFCSAQSQIAARSKLPAFAPPAPPQIPEHERMARLRAQTSRQLLPPPSIASLFGDGGEIAPWRQQDVLVAWQSARKRTSEHALDAADELEYLNVVLGNQFLASKDWTRHRAMLESAFEAFFLPRHRASVASDLCCGACRQGDLAGAQKWLALCDPASDDLFADSAYRLAWAAVAFHKNDFQDMLAALGQSAGEVPIHDAFDRTIAVHRAHAWERLGRTDVAVRELCQTMATSPAARATMAEIVERSGMCPQSFPQALQALERDRASRKAQAGRGASITGFVFLVFGVMAVLATTAAGLVGVFDRDSDAQFVTVFLGAVFSLTFLLVGALLLGVARTQRAAVV